MATTLRPTTVETIHCDVCMKEIPVSEAKNAEVQDYVMHFCGLECYDLWSHQTAPEKPQEKLAK
ncbi:MAG: DUF3330 domain-containing protein [Gammaproteobacteria bacterium]|nr:DUF3330 domain-containing protein [Gammaproteobacteria bacterium]